MGKGLAGRRSLHRQHDLEECWSRMRKDAAYGVDRISAEEYEQHLTENIHNLVERLKRKQYRAKLVRRRNVSAQCWVSG
jgi:retron-type reverse transcriptase